MRDILNDLSYYSDRGTKMFEPVISNAASIAAPVAGGAAALIGLRNAVSGDASNVSQGWKTDGVTGALSALAGKDYGENKRNVILSALAGAAVGGAGGYVTTPKLEIDEDDVDYQRKKRNRVLIGSLLGAVLAGGAQSLYKKSSYEKMGEEAKFYDDRGTYDANGGIVKQHIENTAPAKPVPTQAASAQPVPVKKAYPDARQSGEGIVRDYIVSPIESVVDKVKNHALYARDRLEDANASYDKVVRRHFGDDTVLQKPWAKGLGLAAGGLGLAAMAPALYNFFKPQPTGLDNLKNFLTSQGGSALTGAGVGGAAGYSLGGVPGGIIGSLGGMFGGNHLATQVKNQYSGPLGALRYALGGF
jgi:hypothetical protein